MSWVSKQLKSVGKVAKKAGKAIGKGWEAIDDYALPAIGFALGGPAGAALGAAGARAIGDGKFNAKATLGAGLKGYALGGLAQGAGLAGGNGLSALASSGKAALANPVGTVGNVVKSQLGIGGGAGKAPSMLNANISADGVAPAIANAASGGASRGIMGTLGNAAGWAMKNPEVISAGLSALGGFQAGQQQDAMNKRAMGMQDKALAFAEGQYNERAPFRKLGAELALNQTPQDVSAIYATSNPFAQRYRRLG